MPEEYTKRQALLDCIEMWSELARTGEADKWKTSVWKRTHISCAFCEYNPKQYVAGCVACPARGRWGNGAKTCMSEGSFYTRWIGDTAKSSIISHNPSKRSRQYWARQIVLMCQQLLFELED